MTEADYTAIERALTDAEIHDFAEYEQRRWVVMRAPAVIRARIMGLIRRALPAEGERTPTDVCPDCRRLVTERTSTGNGFCRQCDVIFGWRPIVWTDARTPRERP